MLCLVIRRCFASAMTTVGTKLGVFFIFCCFRAINSTPLPSIFFSHAWSHTPLTHTYIIQRYIAIAIAPVIHILGVFSRMHNIFRYSQTERGTHKRVVSNEETYFFFFFFF